MRRQASGLAITRFDGSADPATVAGCHAVVQECIAADQPAGQPGWSLSSFTAKWADGFDASPQETWAAAGEPGEVAGCYLLMLPGQANRSQASVVLRVAPAARRAGTGTALLAHAADRARLAGRTRLAAEAWDGSAGAAFAAAAGASPGIAHVQRTLRLDDQARARLPALRAAAEQKAAGYSLLSWAGPTGASLLGDLAAVGAAMADAPRDGGVEPSPWDTARVARLEQLLAGRGIASYTVAARHDQTGRLAGYTQVAVDPAAPDCAIQQITAVTPAHRGHRLGLLVKTAMIGLLASSAPAVSRMVTDNAGANAHMVAINEALGFAVSGVTRRWFLPLAAG